MEIDALSGRILATNDAPVGAFHQADVPSGHYLIGVRTIPRYDGLWTGPPPPLVPDWTKADDPQAALVPARTWLARVTDLFSAISQGPPPPPPPTLVDVMAKLTAIAAKLGV